MSGSTTMLPFHPMSMSPAQLAAVSYLARYSGYTHELYASQLRRWFAWCETNGLDPLVGIQRAHVELYIRQLGESGLMDSSVNTMMHGLRGFFRFAHIDGIIPADPAVYARLPDVDEAAAGVAREAPDSHFIHLWADSSTGLDHTARPAVVASAVVRSVARCGGEDLAPAAADEVVRVAGNWIQTATTEELQQTIATLRSREVLESGTSDGSLLIRIPLVGIWLNDGGGRALDGLYASSKHATATTRMVTDSDLVSLSRHLIYRGEHVTEIRIRAWLAQFGDNYHQYLSFRMLRRMILDGYFTSTKLQPHHGVGGVGHNRVMCRQRDSRTDFPAPGERSLAQLAVSAQLMGLDIGLVVQVRAH